MSYEYFIHTLIPHLVVGTYTSLLAVLMLYGLHRYWILLLYWRYRKKGDAPPTPAFTSSLIGTPPVTIQLPLYNEMYVAERLIDSICSLDYPREQLEIQVLDDSTDQTIEIVARKVEEKKNQGFDIKHVRRGHRNGYKAGALAFGTKLARGEYIAIFDADFMPPSGFLHATLPHFTDPQVGMVQTRWGHVNPDYSLLTRLQALFLDGHFLLEHTARYKSGAFFNFNGTAGIWRRDAIESSGGWNPRTLTEDLDLSYRAQLAGWRFVYDPDFVCPAELPVDIHAFHSQQRRWAKGALQVARFILGDLWRAKLPLHTKLEATAHLTANIGYLLTFFVALLLLPSLMLRSQVHWAGIQFFEIASFVVTALSISFFYIFSQKELYPNWKWKIKDVPALLSFGIGMCVSNAIAVWEGLVGGNESEFIRTPKYGISNGSDSWLKKNYARGKDNLWFIQIFFSLYSLLTFFIAVEKNYWGALPFIALFIFGFSYVSSLGFIHRWGR